MDTQVTPLVTFVVPCYNSAAYMERAVDSLLEANHPCEILLINDGSTDKTHEIACSYAERFQNVRAIDQANANWGGAVNHGLELARGTYFKVVDSDDRLDADELHRTLDALANLVQGDDRPDLLVTDYVYDHLPTGTRRIMGYSAFMPEGHVFAWHEMEKPRFGTYIMIHACWFSTEVLRASGVCLPTGMPYTDSLLLLQPLLHVKSLAYLNSAPYLYAIGREDQSIDKNVIARHIDDQLAVTRMAIDLVDYAELYARERRLAELMSGYMLCMVSVSTLNLLLIGSRDALRKNDELWAYLKARNPVLYRKVKYSWVGLSNRRTALGRFLALHGFALVKRIYKLA